MEKNTIQKVAEKVLSVVENNADNHAASFCRYWIGVEKVPQRLLEIEVQNEISD